MNLPDPDTQDASARHNLHVYGRCTIGANVLLAIKGLSLHDPLMASAGIGTATAQLLNSTADTSVKRYTFPMIVVGALVYMGSGIHHGLVGAEHHTLMQNLHDVLNPQTFFGGIKALGAATLFYGKALKDAAMEKTSPVLRLVDKMLPDINPTILGEVILGFASLSLGLDAARELHQGMTAAGHPDAILKGLCTLGAVAGLLVGQHHAAKISDKAPDATVQPDALPRPKQLSQPTCIAD